MRTDDCTPASILGRLAKAEGFLEAADALLTLEESSESVIITNYVHAGIAASDVICCKKLGRHAKGQNHDEAKKLLAQVDKTLSTSLGTLLNVKTEAGYGASPMSRVKLKAAQKAATLLVAAARHP